MKKILTFILWPALAGVSFAAALLLAPWLAVHAPDLARHLTQSAMPTAEVTPTAGLSYSSAIKKASPAVVSINSLNQLERTRLRPSLFLSYLVQETQVGQSNSLGSGVIISSDGYIVTSYHVFFGDDPSLISKAPQITVTFSDGKEVAGNLVQLDAKNDLALIKVERDNLPYLSLSGSSKLEVGDIVLAIGNPHNIGQSVSAGIISAVRRKADSFVIQTDAAINPGNSGGALIDVNGDLIGINSTIVSESGGSEGISFAIAAADAIKLLKSLRDEYASDAPSGYLGVSTDAAVSIEQPGSRQLIQGFRVNGVVKNGPADKAGLRAGDLIIAVGDQKIRMNNPNDPAEGAREIAKIRNLPSYQLVMLTIYREPQGEEKAGIMKVPVILGKGIGSVPVNASGSAQIPSSSASTQ